MINNKMEILDVVDEKGNVVGQATREECHNNPKLIHRVSHCWIFNKKGQVLWQQRSLKKDGAPGAWDMSCGGHVPTGENPDETLTRELNEELGLSKIESVFVEKYLRTNPSGKQTELIYLYYAIVDRSENEFVLDPEETEKVMWIDVAEAQMKYASQEVMATDFIITQVSRIWQKLFLTMI